MNDLEKFLKFLEEKNKVSSNKYEIRLQGEVEEFFTRRLRINKEFYVRFEHKILHKTECGDIVSLKVYVTRGNPADEDSYTYFMFEQESYDIRYPIFDDDNRRWICTYGNFKKFYETSEDEKIREEGENLKVTFQATILSIADKYGESYDEHFNFANAYVADFGGVIRYTEMLIDASLEDDKRSKK